jgi:hypothetical protein
MVAVVIRAAEGRGVIGPTGAVRLRFRPHRVRFAFATLNIV